MSYIDQTSLSSPKDLQVLLSRLNGNFDGLSVHQVKDLLAKVADWRESHASGEFLMSQNLYLETIQKRKAPEYSDEANQSLNGKSYSANDYNDEELENEGEGVDNTSSSLRKPSRREDDKKKELQAILERAMTLEPEAVSDQIPKGLPKNAHVDVDSGIVTVTSKSLEAAIMNEFPRKEEFKKPKKPRVTIPDPFSFDRREAQRRQTISERRFEEYIQSLRQQEEELISRRFVAQPVPASTLEPRYKDLVAQAKCRSEEIKEMSKKWLLKSQRPFEFLKTTKYDDKKKENIKKIASEMKFNRKPFKANPVPEWMDEKRMHIFEEENKKRELRIKNRAKQLLEEAQLPPRMEMWKNASVDLGKMSKKKEEWYKEMTFKPKLNTSVPDFTSLQKEFEHELSQRKRAYKPVQPVPPRCFGENSLTEERRMSILDEIQKDEENLRELRWPYLSTRKAIKPTHPPDFSQRPQTPEKTKTILLREDLVKKHLEEMKAMEEKKKREEENFFQPRLSSSWRPKSANSNNPNRRSSILQAIENNKDLEGRPLDDKSDIKRKALQDATMILEQIGDPDLVQKISSI